MPPAMPAYRRVRRLKGAKAISSLLCVLLVASCSLHAVSGAYTDAKPLHFKGKFDPWKVLGLPKAQALPSNDVLRKTFKKAALKWHPDRCKRTTPIEQCEARMEEVHLAQEVLSDERKLQQWEAWDEDRRNGGPKPEGGREKPFGQPFGRGGPQGGGRGGSGFQGFGDAFGGGGPGFGSGGGRPRKNQQQQRQPPAPRPPPPPRQKPKPAQDSDWRVVSVEKSEGLGGARIEHITRERDLPGTPMVQVEMLEKTCYKAQVQCQETVLERKRRRKETGEL